jgi:hypothetical protein
MMQEMSKVAPDPAQAEGTKNPNNQPTTKAQRAQSRLEIGASFLAWQLVA